LTDVLIVCTANVARSPLFAARLQREADERLAPGSVAVASTGTDTLVGAAAASGSQRVAERWGSSLQGHRATHLMESDLTATPLIITMERRHKSVIVAAEPTAAGRCFTLREFARCVAGADATGDLSRLPPACPDPARRLREVARVADVHRPRRLGRRGDVPDPIGRPQADYEVLGAEFDRVADELGPALFGGDRPT
jgi:protein-tyrosine phosphatase